MLFQCIVPFITEDLRNGFPGYLVQNGTCWEYNPIQPFTLREPYLSGSALYTEIKVSSSTLTKYFKEAHSNG